MSAVLINFNQSLMIGILLELLSETKRVTVNTYLKIPKTPLKSKLLFYSFLPLETIMNIGTFQGSFSGYTIIFFNCRKCFGALSLNSLPKYPILLHQQSSWAIKAVESF